MHTKALNIHTKLVTIKADQFIAITIPAAIALPPVMDNQAPTITALRSIIPSIKKLITSIEPATTTTVGAVAIFHHQAHTTTGAVIKIAAPVTALVMFPARAPSKVPSIFQALSTVRAPAIFQA